MTWLKNQRLELYGTGGGAPRRVVDLGCTHLYWSPDSTKLACTEFDRAGRSWRLALIDAATGAKTTLATGFFESRSALRVVDLATRSPRTIRDGLVASPAWGPTEIAFATLTPRGRNFRLDTAVVKPDGTGYRRLTRFRPTAELWGPHPVAWSADGRRPPAGMVGLDAGFTTCHAPSTRYAAACGGSQLACRRPRSAASPCRSAAWSSVALSLGSASRPSAGRGQRR